MIVSVELAAKESGYVSMRDPIKMENVKNYMKNNNHNNGDLILKKIKIK